MKVFISSKATITPIQEGNHSSILRTTSSLFLSVSQINVYFYRFLPIPGKLNRKLLYQIQNSDRMDKVCQSDFKWDIGVSIQTAATECIVRAPLFLPHVQNSSHI